MRSSSIWNQFLTNTGQFQMTFQSSGETCVTANHIPVCVVVKNIIATNPLSFQHTQESPPAWTQEAYRPPCSEYSFCCPTRVPPPGGVPDRVTPPGGYLTRVPPLGGDLTRVPPLGGVPDLGTPPGSTWLGTPLGGVSGYPPGGGYLTGYPPGGGSGYPPHRCLMAFWEMLQSIMGYGYPPPWTDRLVDGQTRVKTLPSLVLRTRAVKILLD